MKNDAAKISYEVYEGDDLAAEFEYHIERRLPDDACRFWIDGIRLSGAFGTAAVMDAVLLFIQYKCREAGCPAMLVRLDRKNLFYAELYQKFGFYMIDEEEREPDRGRVSCVLVLSYPLPDSRDEILRSHILRSERKRSGNQPG